MTEIESIREQVYQAVVDIHLSGGTAYRAMVATTTGIKQSLVDDHLKRLATDERLVRITPGVYQPAQAFPEERAVSSTSLTSGVVKLEVGDKILELTPREARQVGFHMMGFAMGFGR